MSLKLKICGMRDNLEEVIQLGPDYMGFIFYEYSPRFVADLLLDFSSEIKKVGVFVNAQQDYIWEMINRHGLDLVQLHGDESPSFCEQFKDKGVSVIKVFRVDENFKFTGVAEYNEVADFYLFDTRTALYGGSGERFDWDLLHAYDQHKPFFLSGGLDPQSLDRLEILRSMNIHAIDVNSGVEISPGLKDVKRVEQIIEKLTYLNHEVFGG